MEHKDPNVKLTPEELHRMATDNPKYTSNVEIEKQMIEDDRLASVKNDYGIQDLRN